MWKNIFSLQSLTKIWRHRKPEIVCASLCAVSVFFLGGILIKRHLYVTSSYATLQAYAVPLASQVTGEITQVYVKEHQAVKKGQVLCTIDSRSYLHSQSDSDEQRQALTPELISARTDLKRMEFLLKRGAVARADYDHAVAKVHDLEAQTMSASAQASIAKLNLERTQIVAPEDGVIGFRTAQVGMYASKGAPLFGFIALQDRWVEAKIKETDLSGFQVGDEADVQFDSVPGRKFKGHVESIEQSTETPFAAVPDDFSAGNFSKYAQWLPIHIKVELSPDENLSIPVGTNSEIRMKRRHG